MTFYTVSTEYIGATIRETGGLDITAPAVELAYMATEAEPANGDWQAATWLDAVGPIRRAGVLVGPGGSTQLAAGDWRVWYRFTDTPEIPARPAGWITMR